MYSQLAVIHRLRSAGPVVAFPHMENSLLWQTCLRDILVTRTGEEVPPLHGVDRYEGYEAYRFLLEVICGLHSPIRGETEVQGQFKQLRESIEYRGSDWCKFLRETFNQLARDSKQVRTEHLRGLGGQSYGSLSRKKLRHVDEVAILGSGQLVEEVLPWLAKTEKKLKVFCRRPEVAQEKWAESPQIEIYHIDELGPDSVSGGLLVAAPLSSEEIIGRINEMHPFEVILDLRGESATDPLKLDQVISLESVFSEMNAAKDRVDSAVFQAQNMIKELALCS